jgi:hypothetical protein
LRLMVNNMGVDLLSEAWFASALTAA